MLKTCFQIDRNLERNGLTKDFDFFQIILFTSNNLHFLQIISTDIIKRGNEDSSKEF